MENSNINEVLKSLETLYFEKKYNDTITLLLENKSQFAPEIFHYNLGTTYAQKGNWAVGRYHLERAAKYGYHSDGIRNNLEFVNAKLSTSNLLESDSFGKIISITNLIPESLYLGVALTTFMVLLFLYRIKKLVRLKLGIIIFALSLVPALVHFFYLRNVEIGITLKDAVIRQGPSKIYEEISTIKAGEKFIIGKANQRYFYIKAPSAFVGWVDKDDVATY